MPYTYLLFITMQRSDNVGVGCQSYGGFCAVTYLSIAPEGLHHVLLTGGLPPIHDGCTADAVYCACYKRVALQNAKFYQRFPQDEEIVRSVVLHLANLEGGGVSL